MLSVYIERITVIGYRLVYKTVYRIHTRVKIPTTFYVDEKDLSLLEYTKNN